MVIHNAVRYLSRFLDSSVFLAINLVLSIVFWGLVINYLVYEGSTISFFVVGYLWGFIVSPVYRKFAPSFSPPLAAFIAVIWPITIPLFWAVFCLTWAVTWLIGLVKPPRYVGRYKDTNGTRPRSCCTWSKIKNKRTGSCIAGTHLVWPGDRCPLCKTHYDDIDPFPFP